MFLFFTNEFLPFLIQPEFFSFVLFTILARNLTIVFLQQLYYIKYMKLRLLSAVYDTFPFVTGHILTMRAL